MTFPWRSFLLDVAREPFFVFRFCAALFLDWLLSPPIELPDYAGDAAFRAQEHERRRPGRFVPREPRP